MSKGVDTQKIRSIEIDYDPITGQILRVYDHTLGMEVISFQPGQELEVNEKPLPVRLVHKDAPGLGPVWQCILEGEEYPTVGTARGYRIFREAVASAALMPGGNWTPEPNALHLRYRLERRQLASYTTPDPLSAGGRPIQATLMLDTIGALCARTDWFGPETMMIAAHFGACGPRSHVSLEEGPVAEVVPHLWNMFRRVHPGVQTIPGAIYYHDDGRWLWITCQRPSVGMHWDWNVDTQKAQFEYHAQLSPSEIVHTPEVSLYWGNGGRKEMMQTLNQAFIAYEEPHQDWWYHTCWYWMHWWASRKYGYLDMADQAEYLHDELGLTGFGLTAHDLRPGSWDCSASGLRPSPHYGGDAGLREFAKRVKSFGGHTYVWMPFMGLAAPSLDLKDTWRLKGDDGRPYESFAVGDFDMYHGLNFDHPEVQDYYLSWIRRYIGDYGIDGIFWDCGGTPFPPDFSPAETRPWQRFPSESMCGALRLMEKVMQTGRECSSDFFMWYEAFGTDWPGTGYSTHTGADSFLWELNRCGGNRLVYRSGSTYNLYGGFARINPQEDSWLPRATLFTRETYRSVIEDPMNKWLVSFVREHGCREAVGIAKGVSLCAGHVVVDPSSEPRSIAFPKWADQPKRLRNVLTGEVVDSIACGPDGTTFVIGGAAAYALE